MAPRDEYSSDLPDEWKIMKLSKIINLIGGGTPKRSRQEYWNGNIPWLCVGDFNNHYRYVDSAEEKITELGQRESSTKILEKGQIIISARGTVGALAQLVQPMAFNQSCYGIDAKREYTENSFLYYLIKYSIDKLKKITHGAVFDTITRETFNHIKVKLPPLSEQKAIADILGSLDDKIESNRRMNETLEAMAQTLFKSWFVDFDPVIDNALAAGNAIPNEFKEKAAIRQELGGERKLLPDDIRLLFPSEFEHTEEMGWIPKGWQVGLFGEYVTVKRGGSPRPIQDFLALEGFPWVKISDATACDSRFLKETKQFIKTQGLNKTVKLEPGTLILSNSATPGIPIFLDLQACIHDGWLYFPKKNHFNDMYLYQLFNEIKDQLLMQGNGSIFTNLKTDILRSHRLIIPPKRILKNFTSILIPWIGRLRSLSTEIQRIVDVRNTLLSKLLSGEVRIGQAEQILDNLTTNGEVNGKG